MRTNSAGLQHWPALGAKPTQGTAGKLGRPRAGQQLTQTCQGVGSDQGRLPRGGEAERHSRQGKNKDKGIEEWGLLERSVVWQKYG